MKTRIKATLIFCMTVLVTALLGLLWIIVGVNAMKVDWLAIMFIISGVGSLIFSGVSSVFFWLYMKTTKNDEKDGLISPSFFLSYITMDICLMPLYANSTRGIMKGRCLI